MARRIADKGIVVISDFLSPTELQSLRNEVRDREAAGRFRPAGGSPTQPAKEIAKRVVPGLLPTPQGQFSAGHVR